MTNKQTIEAYVKGDLRLPATFTTGYKRDLDVAREIIRTRTGAGPENAAPDQPVNNTTDVLEPQYS